MPGQGAEECTQCEFGRFQDKVKQTDCLLCPNGTSNSALGQVGCVACEAGRFAKDIGQEECDPCPVRRPTPACESSLNFRAARSVLLWRH